MYIKTLLLSLDKFDLSLVFETYNATISETQQITNGTQIYDEGSIERGSADLGVLLGKHSLSNIGDACVMLDFAHAMRLVDYYTFDENKRLKEIITYETDDEDVIQVEIGEAFHFVFTTNSLDDVRYHFRKTSFEYSIDLQDGSDLRRRKTPDSLLIRCVSDTEFEIVESVYDRDFFNNEAVIEDEDK